MSHDRNIEWDEYNHLFIYIKYKDIWNYNYVMLSSSHNNTKSYKPYMLIINANNGG